ncbi:hypothetical protein BaOVIS_023690 [Babesia ovis]|uniref:FPL domain-containing protein n=1 Tax=Babesia ovis TaxID=5869 RepID=A0A9W5TCH2_BABOV|nr:hypothetical protein BaOVIS_023690 [Babesia ovis]
MNDQGVAEPDRQDVGLAHLERLRTIHRNALNRQAATTASAVDVVDALKQLAELLIWGDKNDNDALFDYFCEENLMEFLTSELPNSPIKLVRIQLLQTMSMLVHNLGNEKMLYYVLSNNYMNTLITHPNIYTGGDVSSWTVSLLKTLSGVLNQTTIKFFYQEGNAAFPLLEEALKFLSSSDSMKRAHVMNIALNILRLNDPSVTRYVLEKSKILTQLALFLRYSWRRLNKHIKGAKLDAMGQTEAILITQCDDVFQFLMDIMDLGNTEISEALLEKMFNICFFPLLGSILRGLETAMALVDSVEVPEVTHHGIYRNAYQQLVIHTGLIGVYASNKSELFGGKASVVPMDTRASLREILSPREDGSPSETVSPRSVVDFQNLNIPAKLLANEMLPNVCYYLLVMHMASVRRLDVRRYLLLMTQCPFIPKVVLEQIYNCRSSRSDQGTNSTKDVEGDGSDTPGDTHTGFSTTDDFADGVHQAFAALKSWERHVYGKMSCHSPCHKSDAPGNTEYVLNVIMGEFLRLAICDLPNCDSRMSMLMALVHSIQNEFIKSAPNPESADDYPFEQYMAVPITSDGLHIVLQGMNSAARWLSAPSLRMPSLHLALCIVRNSADMVKRYYPRELALFVEEVRFHLEAGYSNLVMFIKGELEECTPHHVAIFYDEWLRIEAGTSRRVDILEYPQLLFDTLGSNGNGANVAGSKSGSLSGHTTINVTSKNTTTNTSGSNVTGHTTTTKSAPGYTSTTSDLGSTPGGTHTGITAEIDLEPSVVNTATSNRTSMGLWIFGNSQPSTPAETSKTEEAPRIRLNTHGMDPWQVRAEPMAQFRRHLQAALLVRDTLHELQSWNLETENVLDSPKLRRKITVDQCPLLKDQHLSINGTRIGLGAHLVLDRVKKYACTMVVNNEKKRRQVVCNEAFFLLVRETRETNLFEATCMHPLWNVEMRKVNTVAKTCSVAILWYPESKVPLRDGHSYCDPLTSFSVTEFDIIFETEEDIVEYTRRFNLARDQLTALCAGEIRSYFLA